MGTVNLQRLSGRYSQNETFCGTFLCLVCSVRGPYPSPPFYSDNLVQVPVPVHVDAPYNAPFPVPVQGEPIIKKSVAPAVVTHSNHVAHAGITHVSQTAPIVNAAAYAAAPAAAYVHWAEQPLKTVCVLKQLHGPLTGVTMGFNKLRTTIQLR